MHRTTAATPEGESEKDGAEGEEDGRDGMVEVVKTSHYPSPLPTAPSNPFSRTTSSVWKCLGPMILMTEGKYVTDGLRMIQLCAEAFFPELLSQSKKGETRPDSGAVTIA
jgi:hypothetical protein